MRQAHWEHFHHEADIGVRGFGETQAQAFEQAALAMTAVITEPERVTEDRVVELSVTAQDDELLLYEWLNALIYEMATRLMLFSRFAVSLDDGRLTATASGETVDVARHQPAVEIKGATYTGLAVKRLDNGWWSAQCVVDV